MNQISKLLTSKMVSCTKRQKIWSFDCCLYPKSATLSLDKINHRGKKANAIAMSHRPYVDYRTQDQIDGYQKYLEDYKKQQENLKSRYEYSIRRGKCQIEYDKILEFIPELAPKSLKGYMRMKKMNTKNFLKLKERAERFGINISD